MDHEEASEDVATADPDDPADPADPTDPGVAEGTSGALKPMPRLPNSELVVETFFSLRTLSFEHATDKKVLPYEIKRKSSKSRAKPYYLLPPEPYDSLNDSGGRFASVVGPKENAEAADAFKLATRHLRLGLELESDLSSRRLDRDDSLQDRRRESERSVEAAMDTSHRELVRQHMQIELPIRTHIHIGKYE
jgi:hypothetical protein